MDASTPSLREHVPETAPVPVRGWRRVVEFFMSRAVTFGLVLVVLLFLIGTFFVLADGATALSPDLIAGLMVADLVVVLLAGAVLAGKLTRVWRERRRGRAGAKLHVRLVVLFGGVAAVPAIMVAIFASAFFHFGIQSWFNDRVRTALNEGLQASQGYFEENRNSIRNGAADMAEDLTRAGGQITLNSTDFQTLLSNEAGLRGLTEAMIFEPVTGQPIVSYGLLGGYGVALPPADAIKTAQSGNVAVLVSDDGTMVRAVVALNLIPSLMLVVGKPVDRSILDHMQRTQEAVNEYKRLDQNRSGLQITFTLIFAIVSFLVLFAAVLLGVLLANQIARPIGRLTHAAERVSDGDLTVRVPEKGDDEIGDLSRAFNRMTGELETSQHDLMAANQQLDERRRFTEGVLSGVSAGVVGLDDQGRIELPNRAASALLLIDLAEAGGQELAVLVPEFAPLIERARRNPERPVTAEIALGIAHGQSARVRNLVARVAAEIKNGQAVGFVVTFDDITELQSAQRKAAWADVARRIAHEIKNPLTPIQLAAERLKRRFTKEIKSDPETFAQCADTIVRHVEDIGRMVDEFSRFARMPAPVMRRENIGLIAREAVVLQRTAHPEINFMVSIPETGPHAPCDRGLIGQAITNLLQNAADAVAMREGAHEIGLSVSVRGMQIAIAVTDDGPGLPVNGRDQLTEPYVTTKQKGTGLGLAIVKKIMEEHQGSLVLADHAESAARTNRDDIVGAEVTLILPDENSLNENNHVA